MCLTIAFLDDLLLFIGTPSSVLRDQCLVKTYYLKTTIMNKKAVMSYFKKQARNKRDKNSFFNQTISMHFTLKNERYIIIFQITSNISLFNLDHSNYLHC